jgi:osmotically-inducible protein OsmY
VVPSAKQEQVEARDDDLQKSVEANLGKRDELRGASIDVDVKNGVARLTGSVASEEDRLAAAITARATSGVRAVEDDLRVTGKPAEN